MHLKNLFIVKPIIFKYNLYEAFCHKMETEILIEIKEAEKKADDITEKARSEKDSIIQESIRNSSRLLAEKEEEIRKLQEKKLRDFRDKSKLIKEEKLAEGNAAVKQLKSKSEKNIAKAADFVMKLFEEGI